MRLYLLSVSPLFILWLNKTCCRQYDIWSAFPGMSLRGWRRGRRTFLHVQTGAKIRSLSHKCGWPLSCCLKTKPELRPLATDWSSVWPVRGPCRGFLLGDSEERLHPWNEDLCCSDKGRAKTLKDPFKSLDLLLFFLFCSLEITRKLDKSVGRSGFSHVHCVWILEIPYLMEYLPYYNHNKILKHTQCFEQNNSFFCSCTGIDVHGSKTGNVMFRWIFLRPSLKMRPGILRGYLCC